VDAFASYTDLELRLNRQFSEAERPWITALLEDASTYLRDDVLGQQVYPQSTATATFWPEGGRIDIPSQPLVSIESVQRDGQNVEYVRRDNTLWVPLAYARPLVTTATRVEAPVEVSYTYGYEEPPASLVRWTCVLVSQALLPIEANLGLTAGGLSSVQLDDFRAAFADAGEMSGIALSDRNVRLLREQFGVRQSYVVGTR
jgi:hypothetical protein